MKFVSATTRVTIGLICLSATAWLLAVALGLLPDRDGAVVEGRAALSENVALHCSLLASRNDSEAVETALESLVRRNEDVRSAAVRRPDGTLLASVGNHSGHWTLPSGSKSTPEQMRVPILSGEQEWGIVELRFGAVQETAWLGHPLLLLGVFVASVTYLLFFVYLRKMFQFLDPTKVIPPRVHETLNTLAEGLLVLDDKERIIMANEKFAETIGASPQELTGRKASDLPWIHRGKQQHAEYAWSRAIRSGKSQAGDLVTVVDKNHTQHILRVSAAPVFADDGKQCGALASFGDVTQIEENRTKLRKMLAALSESRDEIRRQNEELERLATRDPLTSCLNRRSFYHGLETAWRETKRNDEPLSCLMIDLDYFKSINDTHGHATGDLVLQKIGKILHTGRRGSDLVCRYGGEEFCVALPNADLEQASEIAEHYRQTIEATQIKGVVLSASFGVSSRSLGARDPQKVIDQADEALYAAKRSGRNRVVGWDKAKDLEAQTDTGQDPRSRGYDLAELDEEQSAIPFQAVTALVSALGYRDPSTADHSRRVADLCAATAAGVMSNSDSYIVEMAALLHDIGKIGVPDSILLKPGPLTDEEWKVMGMHDRIGVEIIEATFSSPKLTDIIGTHHAWFGGNPRYPDLPTGQDIPAGGRILAISDAFDAIVSDRVYRKGRSHEVAFEELRRCAGAQFDPELVECFIEVVIAREGDYNKPQMDASKTATISCAMQIERLAQTLEDEDFAGVSALSKRLHLTAQKYDIAEIADAAAELANAAVPSGESDVKTIVELTGELLDLCRSAQRSYLEKCKATQAGS